MLTLFWQMGQKDPSPKGNDTAARTVSHKDLASVNDALRRLFPILSLLQAPIYLQEIEALETAFGPEANRSDEIKTLVVALELVSRTKDEEIQTLKGQIQTLQAKLDKLEQQKED